jgi:pyruvate,water dikinase
MRAMAPLVLPFSAIRLADLPTVGGKGANLGELCSAGFPVPPGYCLTTRAFRLFLESAPAGVLDPLTGLEADFARVREAGARVRDQLLAVPVPAEVAEAAEAAWRALGTERSYAVRSSATAEDLPDASFAGQQDTFLHRVGWEAIRDGIHRCWVSLFTDRAILYRIQHHFGHEDAALAVVVQAQILPDVSGILFTADPLTSNRAIVAIDAGFGLGEGLVSGKVSADLYQVARRDGKLVHKRIADTALAVLPAEGGGTREVPLTDGSRPALTDAQAEALAGLGWRIEAHYGRPQDIEWCLLGGAIIVLQSRPITTLHPLPDPPPAQDGLHVYVSWNHVQGMTDPMPDLARSLIRLANPFGKAGRRVTDTPYMASAGGRLYHDATDLLRMPGLRRRLPKLLENSDPLMGRALADVVDRTEFGRSPGVWAILSMSWSLARRGAPMLLRTLWQVFVGAPEGKVPAAARRQDAILAGWRARIDAARPGVERLRAVHEMVARILDDVDSLLPLIFAGFAANDSLRALTGRRGDVEDLLRAVPHNVVTEKDLRLADLAELARSDDRLVAVLRTVPAGQDADALARAVGAGPFQDSLLHWFDRFGDRAPGEVDLSRPRYRDDTLPVVRALLAMIEGPPHAFHDQQQKLAEKAESAARALATSALTRWFTRVGRQVSSARELPKAYWLSALGLARRVFLQEGARLAAEGAIAAAGDVWFLTVDELLAVAAGDRSPIERIPERRAAHRRFQSLEPARILTSDGEVVVARHQAEGAPAGALVGTAVSAGVAEGVVRVVHDPGAATLQRGDILVAAYTDPGWTPLFPQAAGLVMEVGGQMTHGSVVAREYGIPAVVCVPSATRLLRDGERVRVDGDHGWVILLDRGSGTSAATTPAVANIDTAVIAAQPANPVEP